MTTNGDVLIRDRSGEQNFQLHAYHDGHLANLVHAMLSLPVWMAETRHKYVFNMLEDKKREHQAPDREYLEEITTDIVHWEGHCPDIVAAMFIGWQPCWLIPWDPHSKEDPPWFNGFDLEVVVAEDGEWIASGAEISPTLKQQSFPLFPDYPRPTLAERIAGINEGKEEPVAKLQNQALRVYPVEIWRDRIWEMWKERKAAQERSEE